MDVGDDDMSTRDITPDIGDDGVGSHDGYIRIPDGYVSIYCELGLRMNS
jgi:hypothetical protein